MTASIERTDIETGHARRLSRTGTLVAGAIMIVLAAGLGVQSLDLAYPSNVFPQLVFGSIGVLSVMMVINAIAGGSAAYTGQVKVQAARRWAIAAVVCATGVFVWFMPMLGFYTATYVFLAAMFCHSGLSHGSAQSKAMLIVGNLALAGAVTAVIYVCFKVMLKVPTPTGLFI